MPPIGRFTYIVFTFHDSIDMSEIFPATYRYSKYVSITTLLITLCREQNQLFHYIAYDFFSLCVMTALSEACVKFKAWKVTKEQREAREAEHSSKKPHPFKFIKVGVYHK